MRFSLSTNWNNLRLNDGAAIADEAIAMGFDALELGFHTSPEQLDGFKSRLDRIPVDSVHAYCPVPIGAPSGHPELHQLAHNDPVERALAQQLMRKTIACAADFGAKVVVTHAGYVNLGGIFTNYGTEVLRKLLKGDDGKEDASKTAYQKKLAKAAKLRVKRGKKLLEDFKRAFDEIRPDLEKAGVTLALENLPRLEGFPNAEEAEQLMREYEGGPIKLWLDTGHARVREMHRWSGSTTDIAMRVAPNVCGMHLNDVCDFHDDHHAPGQGNVDFAALKPLAQGEVLRVFEPHGHVSFDDVKNSLKMMRSLWA